MDTKKIRAIGAILLVALWATLTVCLWALPPKSISEAERRPLAQMPEITGEAILDGSFMSKFADFTLDQFPLRDTFRTVKALFHNYVLQQSDNNGIYLADGYAAKLDYPLNTETLNANIGRFQRLYENYLKEQGSKVFVSVVPDKGFYLAEKHGYPTLDYGEMFATVEAGMPWATFVNITDCLEAEDYYFTDTHWRQEKLIKAAGKLSNALGVTPPALENYTVTALERPFYGVYYGQAALPLPSETMYILENELLKDCTVTGYDNMGKEIPLQVYNEADLQSQDLYDIYLSGVESILKIENPNAKTDRELIIFRDSFGSSMAPLLVQDYAQVTLIDIRYMNQNLLPMFVDFHGQDVLFLYSTLVLNNPDAFQMN